MSKKIKIVMAQENFLVGDIEGNTEKIIQLSEQSIDDYNADVIVFPELTLTGYPPEDLLLRPELYLKIEEALNRIKSFTKNIHLIIGYPERESGIIYNSAAHINEYEIKSVYRKQQLPNYSVFDEKRYFKSGKEPCIIIINGVAVALTICEDAWFKEPIAQAKKKGAQIILNLNASPFSIDKRLLREEVLKKRTDESGLPIVYVNLIGGQDELVFDGESFIINSSGSVTHRAPSFMTGLYSSEFEVTERSAEPIDGNITDAMSREQSIYDALVTGVRDYINKNRFSGAIIGVSGGIDSALTLAIAVDALGSDRVEAVSMPSKFTSKMSIEDAEAEAVNLGVDFSIISISEPYKAFLKSLNEEFHGYSPDTTEENLQARCRGVILMAISNKKGKIVLTTGNKSEMAVGYATLYGDMAGGFCVLKDVPKTLVYRLVKYRNSVSQIIPDRVITRPPTAELAHGQKDTDSLPPYDILDPVLEMYLEMDKTVDEIVEAGYEKEMVIKIIKMVNRNEYKRRQAPPGIKITQRAFGRDRRYPITSGFDIF